jgi:hypothetical protein
MKPNIPSQFKFTLSAVVLVLAVSAGGLIPKSAYAASGDLSATVNAGGALNGGSSIFQYTPAGIQSTFASNLDTPRGLAFDSAGNLFVATTSIVNQVTGDVQGTLLKFTPDGMPPTTFATFDLNFFLQSVVFDSAGNIFVMAQSNSNANNPNPPSNPPSTIYKVTPDGAVTIFGNNPGFSHGLAFDSAGNLFAADLGDQTIFKYTPAGVQSVFVTGSPAFNSTQGEGPVGLAFDSSGNLFVSTVDNNGNGAIHKFTLDGTGSTLYTGLTNEPRGIAVDSAGNLFVAEIGVPAPGSGDILEFTPGGIKTVFASGFGTRIHRGPEYLAFQPGSKTTTSAGLNVTTNAGTVGFATIALTFPQVTSAGTTTVTPVNPSVAGYTLPGSSLGFDITTTATYPIPAPTPPGIVIAFQVARPLDASQLTVYHNEGGSLVNVTCPIPRPGPTPDTTTNTIYASVTSLSPFVVAKVPFTAQVQQPINADGTSVFSVNRGVVPVKFTLTQDGAPTCALPPATISLTRTAGAALGSVDESTYLLASDSGSNFRIDSTACQYVYNLGVSSLGAGTYKVNISIGGIVVGSGTFGLK